MKLSLFLSGIFSGWYRWWLRVVAGGQADSTLGHMKRRSRRAFRRRSAIWSFRLKFGRIGGGTGADSGMIWVWSEWYDLRGIQSAARDIYVFRVRLPSGVLRSVSELKKVQLKCIYTHKKCINIHSTISYIYHTVYLSVCLSGGRVSYHILPDRLPSFLPSVFFLFLISS